MFRRRRNRARAHSPGLPHVPVHLRGDPNDENEDPISRRQTRLTLANNQRFLNDKFNEAERIADHLELFFEKNPLWKFEKVVGHGHYGVAVRVGRTDVLPNRRVHRRLVLKRALNQQGQQELLNEIRWFNALRGSEHIVEMIASRNDVANVSASAQDPKKPGLFKTVADAFKPAPNPNRLRRPADPRWIEQELNLRGLAGYPVMVLEYLENGTLGRLIDRAVRHNAHLPNRLLWSLFLCMVRACVALAYPIGAYHNTPPVLETIPNGTEPSALTHGTLSVGNVMIGGVVNPQRHQEHNLVPVAKFIDLGEATDERGDGVVENLWHVSMLMKALITRNKEVLRGVPTPWHEEDFHLRTTAPELLVINGDNSYPNLDPELRDFLHRCLDNNIDFRPTLEQMLETTSRAVATKTAESYPFPLAVLESDDVIQTYLQHLIFDAETEEDQTARRQDEHELFHVFY
ncbi:hypothetical protein GGR54DRAFT_294061 [Hypoxylon sp. NC1633]|nr:hypothetical protein GGR54DRAFT_294061 [Hypoxylon sp. NC1633]